MKKNKLIVSLYLPAAFLLFCAATPLFAGPEDSPLTLNDCFSLALKQSESVAINRETIREAEAHYTQALGTILPHISFSRSDFAQDTSHEPTIKKHNFDQQFVFKQTLFSGFKEFVGISGSKSEVKQRKFETRRAIHLLFVDVADAFYLLMELRKDIEALTITKKALDDRIAELNERVNIGKSRISELSSTEVQQYTIDAELASVSSQETVARDFLEFLIGQPVKEIIADDSPLMVESEATYIRDSSLRPDVEASRYAWDVDKKKAYIAKTGFLPSVNLESNYYTHKSSSPANEKWDALLSISVPIFEGTETMGQVQESNSIARQSELAYKRAMRLAIQDIHDSYNLFTIAGVRTEALSKALAAAQENYKLQKEDYKLNLVSNLDVLSAIQTLQDTLRTYNSAYYENRRFYWQLRAAGGSIPQTE